MQALANDAQPAEFVICLEVVIHQPSRDEYRNIIDFLAKRTEKTLIISGYDEITAQITANHMLYFHEPLSETLENTGRFSAIRKVGAHSDVTIYRCDVG